jgi:hypothetical protein
MTRGLLATAFTVAAAFEPVANVTGETDLLRYGLTQGGLLAVVLVLLWSYRKDTLSILKERENSLAEMATMVRDATAAQIKTAESVERMGRAIETMNLRREPRDH